MKKLASLILLLALLAVPTLVQAVSAPANLALGPYQQNAAAFVYWDEDTTVSQWLIMLNGRTVYSPLRSQTGVSGTARRSFLMTSIASSSLPAVVSMMAIAPGQPISAASAGVTLTSTAPPGGGTQVYTSPTSPLNILVPSVNPPLAIACFSAPSPTVTTINLTSYLGITSGKAKIRIDSAGGSPFLYQVLSTGTAPTNMTTPASAVGFFHPTSSTTCSTEIPLDSVNLPTWIHLVGSGGTAKVQFSFGVLQ